MTQHPPCPDCGCPAALLESRARPSGHRRRRYACTGPLCGHRWTQWFTPSGKLLDRPPDLPSRSRPRRDCRRLTDRQVRLILTSPRSLKSLAAELGVSDETIRKVRLGLSYADVAPRLPRQRPGAPSCERCSSWGDGACREGFPDPLEEGPAFARDCDLYDELI